MHGYNDTHRYNNVWLHTVILDVSKRDINIKDIKLAMIHARSVLTDNKDCVKSIAINEMIIDKKLDFLTITETWLSLKRETQLKLLNSLHKRIRLCNPHGFSHEKVVLILFSTLVIQLKCCPY